MALLSKLKKLLFRFARFWSNSSDPDIRFCIDKSPDLNSPASNMELSGWIYSAGRELEICFESEGHLLAFFKANQRRPDVALALGNHEALESGFSIKLPGEILSRFCSGNLRLLAGFEGEFSLLWQLQNDDLAQSDSTAAEDLALYFQSSKFSDQSVLKLARPVRLELDCRKVNLICVFSCENALARELGQDNSLLKNLLNSEEQERCKIHFVYDSAFLNTKRFRGQVLQPLSACQITDFEAAGFVLAFGEAALGAGSVAAYVFNLALVLVETEGLSFPGFLNASRLRWPVVGSVKKQSWNVERLVFELEQAFQNAIATPPQKRGLSLILPVYNSPAFVKACLLSLEGELHSFDQLIIVDDASDAQTRFLLENFAKTYKKIQLCLHSENRGFIQACKTGLLNASKENDILLVNSDVELAQGAINCLRQAAYSSPRVALCSPLSTASPHFSIDLHGLPLTRAAELLAYKPEFPTAITPEGQCFYIRREALDNLGFFDDVYGMGFYEESDLAMRYFLNGLDMVVADNTVIKHARSQSFSKERQQMQKKVNRPVFLKRYGRYYVTAYRAFINRGMSGYAQNRFNSLSKAQGLSEL